MNRSSLANLGRRQSAHHFAGDIAPSSLPAVGTRRGHQHRRVPGDVSRETCVSLSSQPESAWHVAARQVTCFRHRVALTHIWSFARRPISGPPLPRAPTSSVAAVDVPLFRAEGSLRARDRRVNNRRTGIPRGRFFPQPARAWQRVAIYMLLRACHNDVQRHRSAAPSALTRFHVKVTFYRYRVSSLITVPVSLHVSHFSKEPAPGKVHQSAPVPCLPAAVPP